MHAGRFVFAQLMDFLPLRAFHACVARYRGDYKIRSFSCLEQFLTLAFAQLTHRESLRDIETSLRAMQPKLYHAGFRSPIARKTQHAYPGQLRRVCFVDETQARRFIFLTNHVGVPAQTIAALYKLRWQVELFFKWIKQHLRIKAFYGTSENAVKIQVWTAITVYVLVAIVKKRLGTPLPLYRILQILSVTLLEKTPLPQLLTNATSQFLGDDSANQLPLFEL